MIIMPQSFLQMMSLLTRRYSHFVDSLNYRRISYLAFKSKELTFCSLSSRKSFADQVNRSSAILNSAISFSTTDPTDSLVAYFSNLSHA